MGSQLGSQLYHEVILWPVSLAVSTIMSETVNSQLGSQVYYEIILWPVIWELTSVMKLYCGQSPVSSTLFCIFALGSQQISINIVACCVSEGAITVFFCFPKYLVLNVLT